MPLFRMPGRRPGHRSYHFRPKNQPSLVRSGDLLWTALFAFAAGLLLLSACLGIRSILNARQNQTFLTWKQAAESEAGPAASPIQFQRMTMPDGSQITRETKQAMGITVPDAVTSTSFHTVSGAMLPEMEALRSKNNDLVGWLTIDGLLDLPVVRRDNTFYMNHGFDRTKNDAGTLFLDENHPVTGSAQNLLIYGHNMRDGSMFGLLTHYQQADYLKKHPFIRFSTLWEKEEYVIFAVVKSSVNPKDERFVSFFTHPTFSSDQEFEMYAERLKALSYHKTYISVKPEDALLTMCTCVGDDRLIVVARKIRANESKAILKTLY